MPVDRAGGAARERAMRFAACGALALAIVLLRSGQPLAGWILVFAGAVVAWRVGPGGDTSPEPAAGPPSRSEWIALAAVVGVAALLRLPRLDAAPPACWFDEAENGLETLRLLAGELRYFTPRNNGRGALQFWWTAPLFLALGPKTAVLRLGSAILGLGTIPVAWAVLRRIGGATAGLLAAALLAVSQWHLTVSRLGFDVVMTPLFDLLALGAAMRALATGRARWGVAAGVAAGLANYGYTASRITPLLVAALFILGPPAASAAVRRRAGLAALATFVAMVAPLILYAAIHPRDFEQRSKQVNAIREAMNQGSLAPIGQSSLATARMLHEHGDDNPRHNRPGRPMLEATTGLLLLLGLAWGARAAPAGAFRFALLWIALPLVAGGALTIGAPHGNRTIAAVVPACLLAAWGARAAAAGLTIPARWRPALAIAVVAVTGFVTAHDYFIRYAGSRAIVEAFNPESVAAGDWLRGIPPGDAPVISREFSESVVRFVSLRDDLRFLPLRDVAAAPLAPGRYLVRSEAVFGGALDGVEHTTTAIAGSWGQQLVLVTVVSSGISAAR